MTAWFSPEIILAAALVIAASIFLLLRGQKTEPHKAENKQQTTKSASPTETASEQKPKTVAAEKTTKTAKAPKAKHTQEVHPLRAAALKGQFEHIPCAAFSHDGSLLAIGSEDRCLFIYSTDSIYTHSPRFSRVNVEYDYPTAVAFSSNTNHMLIATKDARKLVLYKIDNSGPKLQTSIVFQSPTMHKEPIKHVFIDKDSRFMISAGSDEEIRVWSPQGQLLQQIKTNQVRNHMSVCSHDSRFFSCATWVSDVKIWEAQFNKDKSFSSIKKVMDLKGHKDLIWSVSFSHDSKKALTASKDGTARIWNIDVRYAMEEDPRCLLTVTCPPEYPFKLSALSPDASAFATSSGSILQFWSASKGELAATITHTHSDEINWMSWSPDGKHLATTGGDRQLCVWTNPVGTTN